MFCKKGSKKRGRGFFLPVFVCLFVCFFYASFMVQRQETSCNNLVFRSRLRGLFLSECFSNSSRDVASRADLIFFFPLLFTRARRRSWHLGGGSLQRAVAAARRAGRAAQLQVTDCYANEMQGERHGVKLRPPAHLRRHQGAL